MKRYFIPIIMALLVLTACAGGDKGPEVALADESGGEAAALEVVPTDDPIEEEPAPEAEAADDSDAVAVYMEPEPADAADPEEATPAVEVASSGGITFDDGSAIRDGVLYGEGPVGVILVHMGDHECGHRMDMRSWQPFAERLAEEGYRVLVYNARGYGFRVGGYVTGRGVFESLEGAVDFMRTRGGVEQIVIIGAGMGGTLGIRVAAEDEVGDIVGLAVISSWRYAFITESSFSPITDEELARLTMPTLWIVGGEDDRANNMQEMFELAASPDSAFFVYAETDVRGTDLFEVPEYGSRLEADLLAFVANATSSPGE